MTKTRATCADRHVGARVRQRMRKESVTQKQMAAILGVTYQAVSKYWNGKACISAGRLHTIAKTLGVTPNWFFRGLKK